MQVKLIEIKKILHDHCMLFSWDLMSTWGTTEIRKIKQTKKDKLFQTNPHAL